MMRACVVGIVAAVAALLFACVDESSSPTPGGDGAASGIGAPLWNRAAQLRPEEPVAPATALAMDATMGYVLEVDSAWASLGKSAASAGDVNGDGYEDLIVGAPFFPASAGGPVVGRAHVFHGSAAGLAASPAWTATGEQPDAQLGLVVASAGDVDGDGYDDVLVGAPFHDGAHTDGGRAWLYKGSAAGLEASPAWSIDGDHAQALLGVVAGAGDLNGDGWDDVLIGAPNMTSDAVNPCRVFVYYGSITGLGDTPGATLSQAAATSFGFAVAAVGDVNDDGYADVIVGAPTDDLGGADAGKVYVYHGSAIGLDATPAREVAGDQAGGLLGLAVGGAGDVDGDGYDDVVASVPGQASGAGRVMVFGGGASGVAAVAVWSADGAQANEWFGTAATGVGDTNGDGYADVLVGAYQYDGGEIDEGRLVLFAGGATGLAETPLFEAQADQAGANLGFAVAGGDFDGDGYSDLVGGAPDYESSDLEPGEGAVFVFPGCLDSNLDGVCELFVDVDMDGDPAGVDCDDGDPLRYHGADEVADDGIDQDCNGADTVTCAVDGDLDGVGGGDTTLADDGDCTDAGESESATDCNDDDASVYPGADEVADDGIDQDCNGADTTTSEPSGGCGCAVGDEEGAGGNGLLAAVVMLLLAVRRRR